MHPNFLPCASCGKPKVIRLGDYCVACASDSDITASEHEYIILSRATLDHAADRSGITREFLVAKIERAFENYLTYIIYRVGEEWKDIMISDRFYIPVVMKHVFRREGD